MVGKKALAKLLLQVRRSYPVIAHQGSIFVFIYVLQPTINSRIERVSKLVLKMVTILTEDRFAGRTYKNHNK